MFFSFAWVFAFIFIAFTAVRGQQFYSPYFTPIAVRTPYLSAYVNTGGEPSTTWEVGYANAVRCL
jgi:hypothetical protein